MGVLPHQGGLSEPGGCQEGESGHLSGASDICTGFAASWEATEGAGNQTYKQESPLQRRMVGKHGLINPLHFCCG